MADDINTYNVPTTADLNPPTSRMRLGHQALPSLRVQSGQIYEEAKKELRYPYCIAVYEQMLLESTIASAVNLLEILISRPEWTPYVPKNAPQEEKDRAAFIKWNMNNMSRCWADYIEEFISYIKWGFQVVEKSYTKIPSGKYKGYMAMKDFRAVSPKTISKWIYNINTGDLAGVRQDLSRIPSDFNRFTAENHNSGLYNDIPRKKWMLFRYNAKLDNPQGNSPLKRCYIPWKHKVAVEDFELIAVQKDLAGVPHVQVDVDFLAKATDPSSNEHVVLDELKRQAADFSAGEQAYVLSPIAYTDNGKDLFKFGLLDSAGGNSKSYDTDNIIKRNENKMLMSFLADVLKLGTESHGSYSLADAKTSLLAMGVEHHLKLIQNVLNHDLIRQIYALNGWEYDDETSVKFHYGDIEDQDLDSVGKLIQRTASVGALRPSVEVEKAIYRLLKLDDNDVESPELLDTVSTSRAGESQGSSGTGNNRQDNTDNNSDNAA